MADFAAWICATEPALGWSEGTFLAAYKRNRDALTALGLEASPLFHPIVRIAKRGPWQGTATELVAELMNDELNDLVGLQRAYPKTPRQLSQELRRLSPSLAEVGVKLVFSRTAGVNSERIISISSCDVGDAATQPV